MEIKSFINEQPSVLKGMLSNHQPFDGFSKSDLKDVKQILLVGTGSSMNAISVVADTYRGLAHSLLLMSPMKAVKSAQNFGADTLAIVLSQSGQSKDAVEAGEKLLDAGCHVVVMTGDGTSPIAQLHCKNVILPVADETVGPKTKGYFASVLGLYLLANALAGTWPTIDANRLEKELEVWTAKSHEWAKGLTPSLAKADVLAVLGQGGQVGTAVEGSLKIAEMSGLPSFGEETEEMSHGRFHGLTEHSYVIFLTGDKTQLDFAQRLASALVRYDISSNLIDFSRTNSSGVNSLLTGPQLPEADVWQSLFAVVPLQLLAVETAICSGITPEKMRYPDMGKYLGLKLQVPA